MISEEFEKKKNYVYRMLSLRINNQLEKSPLYYDGAKKRFDDLFESSLALWKTVDPDFAECVDFIGKEAIQEIHDEIFDSILAAGIPARPQGVPVIKRGDHKDWLIAEKSNYKWEQWKRYKSFLEKNGFEPAAVDGIDKVSDIVIDLLEKPERSGLEIKGLLYGEVQAGKTATYTAVIHKSADVGWRIIIVLTSNSNDLRLQTQERIENDVIGQSTKSDAKKKVIGIGELRKAYENQHGLMEKYYKPLTTAEFDFSSQHSGQILSRRSDEIAVFVCKKDSTVLKTLNEWFANYKEYTKDLPCLVIDDEADWASINTRKDESAPTKINASIRELLRQFSRSAYLAVTATPYANIFIDPEMEAREKGERSDNLFPHNFIVPVIPPPEYYGVEKLFGSDGEYGYNKLNEQVVIPLEDTDEIEGTTKDEVIEVLPDSLKEALRYFVCSCVYADVKMTLRDKASMLIHIDRFISHHEDIEDLVKKFLEKDKNHIYMHQSLGIEELKDDPVYLTYKGIWENGCQREDANEKAPVFAELAKIEFSRVWKELLYPAIISIQVKVINGQVKEKGILANIYKQDRARLIAIGGNALGRGITLEGLCVTYLSRNSAATDTLLQLGRFFGYKKKVAKFMKIWLSTRVCEKFAAIAEITKDFRERTIQMNYSRKTPDDFGLCLLADPANIGLSLTAANKARHSETIEIATNMSAAYQTQRFKADAQIFAKNQEAVGRFLRSLSKPLPRKTETEKGGAATDIVWENVSTEQIVSFLAEFKCIGWSRRMLHEQMGEILKKDWREQSWDVRLISVKGDEPTKDYYGLGGSFKIGRQLRNELNLKKTSYGQYCSFDKAALMSGNDMARRFRSKPGYEAILEKIKNESGNYPIADVLDIDNETAPAQLLIYTVRLRKAPDFELAMDQPICGLAIGLPTDKKNPPKETTCKYQANEVYLKQLADLED